MQNDGSGVAAMTQEDALRDRLRRTEDALRTLVDETVSAVDLAPPTQNFEKVMRALREAMEVLEGAPEKLSARDRELVDLLNWMRAVNTDDGTPDPALEFLLMLIEREKPHRAQGGGL